MRLRDVREGAGNQSECDGKIIMNVRLPTKYKKKIHNNIKPFLFVVWMICVLVYEYCVSECVSEMLIHQQN